MTVTIEFEGLVREGDTEMLFRVSIYRKRYGLFGPPVLTAAGTYRGDGTGWHLVPDGTGAPSWLCLALYDRWIAKRWELEGD